MSVSSNDSLGFHARMTRLELKLKQSEDERLNLEEKFNTLLRNSKTEESMRLREQYLCLLELDRVRCERNDTILRTLNRVETRASSLTAKTDRLRVLRRCCETYMNRHYQDWNRSEISFSSTVGSVSDIHELSTSRPVSPSPRMASPSPHFSRTPTLTRRGSLIVPDSELLESSRFKFPSEMSVD
ncbi:uncharacterized protein LOC124375011 [Homalodisca vitripennis]|uniref:uncharacterized protein LOC124375011 n=1 Tax=Homalodisca vitripennis TaxID=197043 RepID=UPI001EEA9677|nr:uncharacterized protein LOC124375011 [Homalodisca vitripennis]